MIRLNLKDPQEFAIKLEHHLKIRKSMSNLEHHIAADLSALNEVEVEIDIISKRIDELKNEIAQHKKDYEVYNFKYGLGDSYPDYEVNKRLRGYSWVLLGEAEATRDNLYIEIRTLGSSRDEISKKVGQLRIQFRETSRFFKFYDSHISIFSIVTLDLTGDLLKFILVTEDQRQNSFASFETDVISSDSPIGKSCIGKRLGDSISYTTPNDRTIFGTVVKCELPTVEQLANMFRPLNSKPIHDSHKKKDPFYLHDHFGSNNSRHRKGG